MKKFQIPLLLWLATGAAVVLTGCRGNTDTMDEPTYVSYVQTVDTIDEATETAEIDEVTVATAEAEIDEATNATPPPPVDDVTETTEIAEAQVTLPSSFVQYVSENYGFSLYHPGHWVNSSGISDLIADEVARGVHDDFLGEEAMDMLIARGASDDGPLAVEWFDPRTVRGMFMANISVLVTPSAGLNQAILGDSAIKEIFAEMFDEMFAQAFENFVRTSDVHGEMFGNNYFIFFSADAESAGTESSFIQFFTAIGDNSYTITFSAPRDMTDLALAKSIMATFNA